MIESIILILIGLILLLIGIKNYKGDISLIHSYHRHRVSEENKVIFSKLMGLGMIACSIGIILFSISLYLSKILEKSNYITVGSYLLVISLFMGVVFMIYATTKYNKGII